VTLLLDHGVEPGDDPLIGHLLDQMLDHQDAEGRFPSYANWPPVSSGTTWTATGR
jgi:hypothetical protein